MLAVAALALSVAAAVPAQAAELVINGGFETGDFSGWGMVGSTLNSDVNSDLVMTGNYAARFGNVGSLAGISQNLTTIQNQSYVFSFDLQNYGGETNKALITFGATTLVNLTNPVAFGYTHYVFMLNAAGPVTTIGFRFQNDPSYYHLDNVSVLASVPVDGAVPEPATWAMLMLGMFGVGAMMRLRRRPATA